MALTSGMVHTCVSRLTYLSLAEDGEQSFSFWHFSMLISCQFFIDLRP